MSESIRNIAKLITEDPDVFSKYGDMFQQNTVLDMETYGEILSILKEVAHNNGLRFNHHKAKIKFNPAGFTIKNIDLECTDATSKSELAQKVAEITGDENIKHTFNKNLKVNLYNAINGEFADRVREELNLEVTHQFRNTDGVDYPMITFTQPAVRAEKPEKDLEIEPGGPEPLGGPEVPEAPEMDSGMPGLPPLEGPGEDMDMGPFGLEPPEEGEEEPKGEPEEGEEEPEEGEEDEGKEPKKKSKKKPKKKALEALESINRIAKLITDDPDIFA